ncbi:hypothetical protein [Paracraurococcus ruber]|uniref:SPOR domain-containing protein n=1 Tax=Paracraurococcus ruber TaxID=77675 RepID=A0ABS1D5D9_9PROT|nr:hypothetical protein [Paracraurococcus ruber]MBK1661099.1 hypothetical protein [Paracraurococcus ruber]TDG25715.1 hypothetical protein E2C05_25660 [Paracraurococcus ruber]
MATEWPIKRLDRPDKRAWLVILARSDGLFRFEVEAEMEDAGYAYAGIAEASGLYASAGDAEREARRIVPWLRDPPAKAASV